jgi:hypothetical protein
MSSLETGESHKDDLDGETRQPDSPIFQGFPSPRVTQLASLKKKFILMTILPSAAMLYHRLKKHSIFGTTRKNQSMCASPRMSGPLLLTLGPAGP